MEMLLSSSQQIACEQLTLFIRGSKKSPESRARKETRERGVEKNSSATCGSCVLSRSLRSPLEMRSLLAGQLARLVSYCGSTLSMCNILNTKQLFRACLHGGGGPQVGEVTCGGSPYLSCKRDQIKMRDYMDRRVTSPSWGPPPPCKEALRESLIRRKSFFVKKYNHDNMSY